MLCPFYRYIDKRAAYALPPEILTYGDIFYISVPVPIFSQFNFSDAFIVLVVKIYYLISIVNIFKAICLLILFILFVLVGLATADARPNLHYDLINPADGRNYGCPEKGWRYDRNTMNRLIQEGRIIWPDNPDGRPRKKSFLNELSDNLPGFSSVFSTGVYTNTATKEIGGLFNKYLFDFPKPVEVIKQLVSQVSNTDDIILDFFSGSATTAHAVMQLNAEDGGNRRFILVQLPELCDEKSEAYKTGYKNICEIGKERIRRAGKMLKDALESSGLFVRAMKRHQDQHDSLEGFAYAEWEESPEVINAKKEMFCVAREGTNMATAWGDESVRKTGVPSPMYLMGACVCDDTETETRQRLALLKPKGARKLHWRDMRPSLRGKVVDAMAAMDIDHVIVAAVPMSQWNTAERARRKCLERLLPLLETEYNVDTLVLERREISQDRNDIRFIDGLRSRRFIGPIRVELCAGETDARLWLPDQLLGAYGDAQAGTGRYDEFLGHVRTVFIDSD